MEIVVNSKQAAEFFGVSRATLSDWTRQGCPKLSYGKWNLQAVFRWWSDTIISSSEVREELQRERLRLQKAKADIGEMEATEMKGSLIRRDEVAQELVNRVYTLKSDLLALPKRLARWPEAKEISHKYVIQLLKTYSRQAGVFAK